MTPQAYECHLHPRAWVLSFTRLLYIAPQHYVAELLEEQFGTEPCSTFQPAMYSTAIVAEKVHVYGAWQSRVWQAFGFIPKVDAVWFAPSILFRILAYSHLGHAAAALSPNPY